MKLTKLKKVFETVLFILFIVSVIFMMTNFGTIKKISIKLFRHPLVYISHLQRQYMISQSELCRNSSSVVLTKLLCLYFSILQETDEHYLVFLLETSNKSSITVRQGCALESCVKFSGRNCILVTLSTNLNVCDNKVKLDMDMRHENMYLIMSSLSLLTFPYFHLLLKLQVISESFFGGTLHSVFIYHFKFVFEY